MMRQILLPTLVALAMAPALGWASPDPISNETVSTEPAQDKAESPTAAEVKPDEAFTPPPGYRQKKRGKKMVYCKKDLESGTRFASEICYDEEQLREMQRSREIEKTAFDQSRRLTCSNPDSCAGG